jgi:hypothetical protein
VPIGSSNSVSKTTADGAWLDEVGRGGPGRLSQKGADGPPLAGRLSAA